MYLNTLKTSIIFNRLKFKLILPQIEGPVEEPLHSSHLSDDYLYSLEEAVLYRQGVSAQYSL